MRVCIWRNCGTMRRMISPSTVTSTGTLTAMTQDRPMSSRNAMITPPTHMIGAMTIMVQVITTSICTCWTSFVLRVISDGAPKCAISRLENSPTRPKIVPRRSRPTLIAVRAPKYTAVIEQAICTRLTASIHPPVRMM
jgi:hypothetical protein